MLGDIRNIDKESLFRLKTIEQVANRGRFLAMNENDDIAEIGLRFLMLEYSINDFNILTSLMQRKSTSMFQLASDALKRLNGDAYRSALIEGLSSREPEVNERSAFILWEGERYADAKPYVWNRELRVLEKAVNAANAEQPLSIISQLGDGFLEMTFKKFILESGPGKNDAAVVGVVDYTAKNNDPKSGSSVIANFGRIVGFCRNGTANPGCGRSPCG